MKYKGTDKMLALLFCMLALIFAVFSVLGNLPQNIYAALLEGVATIALIAVFYFKNNLMCGAFFIIIFVCSRINLLLDDEAELLHRGITLAIALVFVGIFTKLFYSQKEEDKKRH